MARTAYHFAPLAYGFRPFFLLAGVYAALAIPAWLILYSRGASPFAELPALLWHGHEMLYGFVAAALAGFVLTAVPSWTGARGFGGWPLAAVVVAWLLGRSAFALAGALPGWAVVALELAFLPALGVLIAPPLLRSYNRNTPLLALLAALWLADGAYLLGWLRDDPLLASGALRVAIDLVLLLVTIIGGRIVPSFTSNALRRRGEAADIRSRAWVERGVVALMLAVIVVDLWRPDGAAAGWLAAAVALAHAVRLSGWRSLRVRGEAILWVLHVAYAWLPVGFALKAAWMLARAPWAAFWMHALTMGVFGTMILAVMTRAALGHTGRPLAVGRSIAGAYLLLTLAVVARVLAPALWPSAYLALLVVSGSLWTAGFVVYLAVYAPILLLARADGKPG